MKKEEWKSEWVCLFEQMGFKMGFENVQRVNVWDVRWEGVPVDVTKMEVCRPSDGTDVGLEWQSVFEDDTQTLDLQGGGERYIIFL